MEEETQCQCENCECKECKCGECECESALEGIQLGFEGQFGPEMSYIFGKAQSYEQPKTIEMKVPRRSPT